MCRAMTHPGIEFKLSATWQREALRANKSADCRTTTGHRAAFDAADPDGRRAPGLQSLDETTQWCLLDMIELSRRGSNP
jgi:hypothetical protein